MECKTFIALCLIGLVLAMGVMLLLVRNSIINTIHGGRKNPNASNDSESASYTPRLPGQMSVEEFEKLDARSKQIYRAICEYERLNPKTWDENDNMS